MIFTFKHYSGAYLSKWSKHRRNNSTIITRRVSDFFVFDGIVQFTLVWIFFRFFFLRLQMILGHPQNFDASERILLEICKTTRFYQFLKGISWLGMLIKGTWLLYLRFFFFYCSDPVKLLLRRLNTSGAFSVITYVRQHISNRQLHFSLSKIIKGGKKHPRGLCMWRAVSVLPQIYSRARLKHLMLSHSFK